ncbi:GNAT family N-acetyltransferase [Spongiactinospora sp. TRM90649]|uniref:GNAT family N-acetyltransferase n=1 Tax=Spongiactinospora sp. TRM90649 TaxID=3031114 RepID=UPI0023F6D569|nr:GNAT family N-acetyltransferase [Spongiactinospora sp. TRM90649]MDF5754335.1 GNAT family N-acetyltransferase [Spongiactinospora sp. TRM90649]
MTLPLPHQGEPTHIRTAALQDASALAAVQAASWRAAFRGLLSEAYLDGLDHEAMTKTWEEVLADAVPPRAGTLAAEQAGRLVGYARFHPTDDDDDDPERVGMIGALYTVPEVWGTGVGRSLIIAATGALRSAGFAEASLWVIAPNTRARAFYDRGGWRHDGSEVFDPDEPGQISKLRYRRSLTG